MGAVRGASICAFTASISIAENGNNSLLFIKINTREKYLYRYIKDGKRKEERKKYLHSVEPFFLASGRKRAQLGQREGMANILFSI